MRLASQRILILGVTLAAACGDDSNGPDRNRPVISDAAVAPNATNALAAEVRFRVDHADSVRLAYTPTGGGTQLTPAQVPAAMDTVPLLGLLPDTTYAVVIQAFQGNVTSSTPLTFRSDTLPADLRQVHMTVTGTPTPGYTVSAVMVGLRGFIVAFDSTGRLAWYREMPLDNGELVTDIHRWPNGNYTVFAGASTGWQPVGGAHVEITPRGEVRRLFRAPPPYYTDNHELLLQFAPDNSTLTAVNLFGYDLRTTDLTPVGGPAASQVAGHQLVRMNPAGATQFFWNGWDYFRVSDWIENAGIVNLNPIDFDHPNSLAIMHDGNYLVSWRHLAEINKIHASSGRLMWRLGGVHNQFTFVDDPEDGFSAQHYAREVGQQDILLFDNGVSHAVPESRAVQYHIDEVAHTATMVWEYRHVPAYNIGTRGSVDRLTSGNTFIGWATLGRVEEVTAAKQSLWEGAMFWGNNPLIFYRAFRTPSLYRFQQP